MRLTKDIYREVNTVRKTISNAEARLAEITEQLLLNIEYEKAGDYAPYDYSALHEEAQALRAEAAVAPEALTDKAALFAPSLFPTLKGNGALIKVGTRINHNGTLYRASSDLWDVTENNPFNAPTLWEAVTYTDGVRDIPEVITAASAFYKGELGWWNGAIYESLIDNNVYNPTQYAAGWLKRGDK